MTDGAKVDLERIMKDETHADFIDGVMSSIAEQIQNYETPLDNAAMVRLCLVLTWNTTMNIKRLFGEKAAVEFTEFVKGHIDVVYDIMGQVSFDG